MIIKELMLTHFGKFHNSNIELGPRMNIIYGTNEAGKSTIHWFIHGMLFGVRRLRGKAAASDMYSRYQPWDSPASYEGLMVFEHQGQMYRLYRNFYKEESKVRLIQTDTKKEIALEHGIISDFIPEFTEENFKNTISIGQQDAELEARFSLSLQSYAANMSSTGSQNIHLGQALEYLKQEKRKLAKESKAEEIKNTLAQIREKEGLIQQEVSVDAQIAGLKQQMKDLTLKLKSCQEEMAVCQVEEGMLGQQQKQVEQAYIHARKAHMDYEKRNAVADVPIQKPVKVASDRGLSPVWGAVIIGLCALCGAAAAVFRDALPMPVLVIIFAICLAGLAGGIVGCIRMWKREPVSTKASAEYDYVEIEDDLPDESKERLLSQVQSLHKKLEEIALKIRQLPSKKSAVTKKHQQFSEEYESLRQHLDKISWEQEKRNESYNLLEDMREELEKLKEGQQRLKMDTDAVQMAHQMIKSLSSEIHENFGAQLETSVESMMQEITGKARRFSMDSDFKIAMDNSRDFVDIGRLSMGTIDQLYFALRINAAKILFGNQSLPLILDDTFAYYDDARLQSLLKWLMENYSGQILIFTCHRREADLLDSMNYDYNYVNLD